MIKTTEIQLDTKGFTDIIDITESVAVAVEEASVKNGLVTVFCPGSTAAVTTIEYEPGVIEDLRRTIELIAPSTVPYEHNRRWGDGNGFSHVRAALMKPSLSVPVINGEMVLGTWQQIVFIDFDNRKRRRRLIIQVVGDD
ncbi:MAG: YjbQ family protein [Nitrospirae bacterium]|nr:MAG: YjbQ family protein [Nitrospirota bacterium]